MNTQTYNYKMVRQLTVMTVVWGIVGMLVGVIVAAQLFIPSLDLSDVGPWFHFGHLRPLHANVVIFASGGCGLMGTSYYVAQCICNVCLFGGNWLSVFTFWGWQAAIVAAAISLPMGFTQAKEYTELEWSISILIALVWIAYAVVFFGTITKRKVKHIYIANWFYGGLILAIALLHIANNISIPTGFIKPYPVYPGAIDAMMQWWYGHSAVGFFLTAGFLGMMYYFAPKQAARPIYSRRLSVVHLWVSIFTCMWAGSHHFHYTALPDWTQSLGMVLSPILFVPSWGGMTNDIMILSGAQDKLRTDPALRFLMVSLPFHGMSIFEGPMMSIKTINSLGHYTDWTIAHVHTGALGWVGLATIGSVYYMIPRLFGKNEMHSIKLTEVHSQIATIDVALYIAAMWVAGVYQGLVWGSLNKDGTLTHSLVEPVKYTMPYYQIRFVGSMLYPNGMCIMAYSVYRTAVGGRSTDVEIPVVSQTQHH